MAVTNFLIKRIIRNVIITSNAQVKKVKLFSITLAIKGLNQIDVLNIV